MKRWFVNTFRSDCVFYFCVKFLYQIYSGYHYRQWSRRRNLQKIGPLVLGRALEVCHGIGLKPFLTWGTLLGCCREGGFIRNDFDIDLGLLQVDSSQIKILRIRMESADFELRKECLLHGSFCQFGKHSMISFKDKHSPLWVDFDIYFLYKDSFAYFELKTKKNELVEKTRLNYLRGELTPHVAGHAFFYKTEVLVPFKKMKFLGLDVFVPAQSKSFLELTYGAWKKPSGDSYDLPYIKHIYISEDGDFSFKDVPEYSNKVPTPRTYAV